MRAPDFWYSNPNESVAFVLKPLGWIYGFVGRTRASMTVPFRASVPVICIGNLTAGGTGKTPLALAIGEILKARGLRVAFLSRGYGADVPGAMIVDASQDSAKDVGDEPLMLAQRAMAVVSPDRPAGARLAISRGAQVVVMDDGFQNPGLKKDLSFVVVDAAKGFGNGCLIPAGPLRERIEDGLARAQGVIAMGEGHIALPVDTALLRATLVPMAEDAARLKGQRVLAFAGIGDPKKFFATLEACGADVVSSKAFADHYAYSEEDLGDLKEAAQRHDAIPVTTEKDFLRLAPAHRTGITALRVVAQFEPDSARLLEQLIDKCLTQFQPPLHAKH
ncbi:MAG: tetraacyldisaccharide 4'-kinase [Alphaproteobacteria bacterium]|nr:tetraacyldisaccharide 4'-kinase [Alphaproteobacteria bacterium]